MIPAKAKDFTPEVSKRLGLPEEDLSNMVSFYFEELKRELSELKATHFSIRGLGTMLIRGWEIEKEIEVRKKSLSLSRIPENIQALEKEIALYEAAHVKWLKHRAEKREAHLRKQQYYKDKLDKIDKNELEGKDPNSLGE